MAYVETYVLPVPAAELDAYFDLVREMAVLWKEFGVLKVTEYRPQDVPVGEVTSFPRAVQATEGETVAFGTMQFKDRAHRDAVMEVAMADERMQAFFQKIPVDGKRMFWGAFTTEVDI